MVLLPSFSRFGGFRVRADCPPPPCGLDGNVGFAFVSRFGRVEERAWLCSRLNENAAKVVYSGGTRNVFGKNLSAADSGRCPVPVVPCRRSVADRAMPAAGSAGAAGLRQSARGRRVSGTFSGDGAGRSAKYRLAVFGIRVLRFVAGGSVLPMVRCRRCGIAFGRRSPAASGFGRSCGPPREGGGGRPSSHARSSAEARPSAKGRARALRKKVADQAGCGRPQFCRAMPQRPRKASVQCAAGRYVRQLRTRAGRAPERPGTHRNRPEEGRAEGAAETCMRSGRDAGCFDYLRKSFVFRN